LNQFARVKIDDFNDRVILSRKKEPVALEVNGKMIKIALLNNPRHWNSLLQRQRRFILSPNAKYQNKKRSDQSGCSPFIQD
jgi:hypothetical protein